MTRSLRLLVVDDDPGDVMLVTEALGVWSRPREVEVCADGEAACARVTQAGLSAACPVPDLVILDLNLPRRGGREVYGALRANALLCDVPVVVFTTSTTDQDVVSRCDPSLNLYLSKPLRLQGFVDAAERIRDFFEAAEARRKVSEKRG